MKISGFVFVQMLRGHIAITLIVLTSLHADYVCLSRYFIIYSSSRYHWLSLFVADGVIQYQRYNWGCTVFG